MSPQKPILLVEDNPSDADLTRRALAKGKLVNQLLVVEDGQEALDYLRGEGAWAGRDIQDLPALVLLDLKLPKIPGLEVLRRIREDERISRVPIVILTSSNEDTDVGSAYDFGVNSYVRKPVDYREFQVAIEHLGLFWLLLNQTPQSPK